MERWGHRRANIRSTTFRPDREVGDSAEVDLAGADLDDINLSSSVIAYKFMERDCDKASLPSGGRKARSWGPEAPSTLKRVA
jgi:hypothetical protein